MPFSNSTDFAVRFCPKLSFRDPEEDSFDLTGESGVGRREIRGVARVRTSGDRDATVLGLS